MYSSNIFFSLCELLLLAQSECYMYLSTENTHAIISRYTCTVYVCSGSVYKYMYFFEELIYDKTML